MKDITKFVFQTPTNIMFVGPSGAGKTQLALKILNNRETLFKNKFNRVIYCYTAHQPFMSDPMYDYVEFTDKLVDPEDFDEKHHSLLILDDMLHTLSDKRTAETLSKLFMVNGHHKNITVIMMVQNLFSKEKKFRDLSVNCHYIILFALKRDLSQVTRLGSQLMPKDSNTFLDIYKQATSERYSYLLIDLHPSTKYAVLLRENILPDDIETVHFRPQ